jgi:hypothetical protein
MGRSIDLYSYDYEKLVNKILKICNTEDRELVKNVLLSCGNKIADRYIILNQELWENCSCYYNVSRVLSRIFKIDDVFGKVFCVCYNTDVDEKTLINTKEIYEIEDELGIEIPESEDEE